MKFVTFMNVITQYGSLCESVVLGGEG